MIKVTQRIPTTQYGFIELEMEYESAQEAITDHTALVQMYEDKVGLDASAWKRVRIEQLETGEVDLNLLDEMSKAQRWLINENKKTLRDIKNKE